MNLTQHFTLAEMTRSDMAARQGLPNQPNPDEIKALVALCRNILEPLRDLLDGKPITISSGYRSPAVNRAVGGSRNSQHCAGEAADIRVEGLTAAQLFDVIRASELPFDQLINEFGQWVHVSYSTHQRRQQCLVARWAGGQARYENAARRPVTAPLAPARHTAPQSSNSGPIPGPIQPVYERDERELFTPRYEMAGTSSDERPWPELPPHTEPPMEAQPSLGQRLAHWVDSMDASRFIGTLSFIATATFGASTLLGDFDPVLAAKLMTVSGGISAFCGRLQGAGKGK